MRKETPDQASPAVKHVLDGLRAAETQHLTNCTLYRPSTMFTGDNAILSIESRLQRQPVGNIKRSFWSLLKIINPLINK